MPLSFLVPGFLAGLALLAIPIVVHLTRRDRTPPLAFPSLMFLREVPHASVRRRRIRHWPLLFVRCLALALVVLAFARPFADGAEARLAPPGSGGREVVLLLDRSYSMSAAGRWERARGAARRIVSGLGEGDRATLVLFDAVPSLATAEGADRPELLVALDSARPSAGATRYTPALAYAAQILARSSRRTREAVLITDFQRVGWAPDEEARLPSGARLVPVDIGGTPPTNVSVTGIELRRDVASGRERVTAVARLASTAGGAERDVTATLEVNGRAVESRPVRLPAGGAGTVAFAPVALPDGPMRGSVRAGADDLPADNVFHFATERNAAVRILLVDGRDARPGSSLYLRRAFGAGGEPPFRVEMRRGGTLRAADLTDHTVVVLNDAPPTASAARVLVEHVRRGGGLIIALGEESTPAAWPAEAAPLLPATPGRVVDRSDDGGARLAAIERAHPVFEAFAAPRSGDLTAPRVLRYRTLAATDASPALARFDDGAPALVEHALGAGRVLLWATTLDSYWTDLALRPVFVPLVHRMATYASRHDPGRPWRTVGETVDLASDQASAEAPATPWVIETPSGRRERPGESGGRPALALTEQGFYTVRPAGAGSERSRQIAVNLEAAESDLARVEPAEVVSAVEGRTTPGASGAAGAEAVRLTAAERERQQGTWWYLLAGAMALLATEAALANRLSRVVR